MQHHFKTSQYFKSPAVWAEHKWRSLWQGRSSVDVLMKPRTFAYICGTRWEWPSKWSVLCCPSSEQRLLGRTDNAAAMSRCHFVFDCCEFRVRLPSLLDWTCDFASVVRHWFTEARSVSNTTRNDWRNLFLRTMASPRQTSHSASRRQFAFGLAVVSYELIKQYVQPTLSLIYKYMHSCCCYYWCGQPVQLWRNHPGVQDFSLFSKCLT